MKFGVLPLPFDLFKLMLDFVGVVIFQGREFYCGDFIKIV